MPKTIIIKTSRFHKPITQAADAENFDEVKRLVNQGVDLTQPWDDYYPLSIAMNIGDLEMVQFLYNHGMPGYDNTIEVQRAIASGDYNCTISEVCLCDWFDFDAFDQSIECYIWLVEQGAPFQSPCESKDLFCKFCFFPVKGDYSNSDKLYDLLVEKGAHPEDEIYQGWEKPFISEFLSSGENFYYMKKMIDLCSDLDHSNLGLWHRPLWAALESKSYDVFMYLIDCGARLDDFLQGGVYDGTTLLDQAYNYKESSWQDGSVKAKFITENMDKIIAYLRSKGAKTKQELIEAGMIEG